MKLLPASAQGGGFRSLEDRRTPRPGLIHRTSDAGVEEPEEGAPSAQAEAEVKEPCSMPPAKPRALSPREREVAATAAGGVCPTA